MKELCVKPWRAAVKVLNRLCWDRQTSSVAGRFVRLCCHPWADVQSHWEDDSKVTTENTFVWDFTRFYLMYEASLTDFKNKRSSHRHCNSFIKTTFIPLVWLKFTWSGWLIAPNTVQAISLNTLASSTLLHGLFLKNNNKSVTQTPDTHYVKHLVFMSLWPLWRQFCVSFFSDRAHYIPAAIGVFKSTVISQLLHGVPICISAVDDSTEYSLCSFRQSGGLPKCISSLAVCYECGLYRSLCLGTCL